jgi:Ricin-type beta-trefoil lectin domain-like
LKTFVLAEASATGGFFTELLKNAGEIISKAGATGLTLFALAIIVFGLLTWRLSEGTSVWARLLIFFAVFFGVVAMGVVVLNVFPSASKAKLFDPNGRYLISSVLGKVLDVDLKEGQTAVQNHADIQLWDWHGGENQIWSIEERSDGTYVIRSDSSAFALDVERGKDRIQLYNRLGTPNQKWRIEPVQPDTAEPIYKIISIQSNKVLDADIAKGIQGAKVQQSDWYGGQNQQWRIEPAP